MSKSVFSEAHDKLRSALVAERKAAGVTQVQLAARLQKPQSFVSKFERGERRLDVIEFVAVSDALDVDPSDLLARILSRLTRPFAI
ncbi:MAG: helix-turn-helix domain-containing protein [Parcubacteria group bacterium]